MAVSASNTRWRSDGFEFCREDGARLLVTFVLECCDREAIGWVASLHDYSEWRRHPRHHAGVREKALWPAAACHAVAMAERQQLNLYGDDEARLHHPYTQARSTTALRNLAIAFEHYNEQHPHSALKHCSPREFRRLAKALT